MSGEELSDEVLAAARLVTDYLSALWGRPCSDCWEEFPEEIHTYTLGAVYAGLKASASLVDRCFDAEIEAVRTFILENCVQDGRFIKYIGLNVADASLLGLAVPYGVVAPDDPIMMATVEQIESILRMGGGVHRTKSATHLGVLAYNGWESMRLCR